MSQTVSSILAKIPYGTVLYVGLRVLVALSVVLFLARGSFVEAASAASILALMLVPELLRRKYDVHVPFEIEVSVVAFIFFTLFLGSLNNFYERIAWWDLLLHFQSGILLGIIGFSLIYVLNRGGVGKLALSPFFVSFFSVCFSMAVSVVWEIYEFGMDSFFGYNMQRSGLPDTMEDLIVNTLGALIVGVVAFGWMHARMRIPFTPRRLAGSRYDPSRAISVTDGAAPLTPSPATDTVQEPP